MNKGPPSYCTFLFFFFFLPELVFGELFPLILLWCLEWLPPPRPPAISSTSVLLSILWECYRAERFSGSVSWLQASQHLYVHFFFLLLFCQLSRSLLPQLCQDFSRWHWYTFHFLQFFLSHFPKSKHQWKPLTSTDRPAGWRLSHDSRPLE